jgi:UDP-glucose 4-epimerase
MKVLVTGALGVNGVWVCRRLSAAGHEVVAFDVRPDDASLDSGVASYSGDVTDTDRVLEILRAESVDAIVHLAAALAAAFAADPAAALVVNTQGTIAVLRAALAAEVRRVVFSSSMTVYRPFEGPHGYPDYAPISENYPRGPMPAVRLYGASKILCEELGRQFHEDHGIEFVALRFPHILAPGRSARQIGRAPESSIVDPVLAGRPVTVSGGDERADFLYVKDLANSVERALVAPGDPTGEYNIGSGGLSTLHDVAAAVAEIVSGADITVEGGRDFLGIPGTYGLFDIAAAARALGYEPKYDLRAAVADYVNETRAAAARAAA